jgi:hypothetical protein
VKVAFRHTSVVHMTSLVGPDAHPHSLSQSDPAQNRGQRSHVSGSDTSGGRPHTQFLLGLHTITFRNMCCWCHFSLIERCVGCICGLRAEAEPRSRAQKLPTSKTEWSPLGQRGRFRSFLFLFLFSDLRLQDFLSD